MVGLMFRVLGFVAVYFFFQAEDGIRDYKVTGVQTCALPIWTVIVDEIHAVIGTRRGAHLALSLERLQEVVQAPLARIGLSATQKPVDEVARDRKSVV